MQQDFRVGVPRQMEVRLRQDFLPQFLIVGQLAVEAEGKPLVLLNVLPLERLGVPAIVGPAGGVPHVADGRHARVLVHQGRGLSLMVQMKDLGDGPDILVRVEQLRMARPVDRQAGRKLAAILNLQQQSWNVPRDLRGITLRCQPVCGPRQMVDRGNPTFVKQIGHEAFLRRSCSSQ